MQNESAALKKLKKKLMKVIKGSDVKKLEAAKKPEEIQSLLARYKLQIARLKTRGDSDARELRQTLKAMVILRRSLSIAIQEKQMQLINQHWESIKKKNKEFVEKMQKQMDESRENIAKFFVSFDRDTVRFNNDAQRLVQLQEKVDRFNIEIKAEEEKITKYADDVDKSINEQIKSALGDLPQLKPEMTPSFKRCVHKGIEDVKRDMEREEDQVKLPGSSEDLSKTLQFRIRSEVDIEFENFRKTAGQQSAEAAAKLLAIQKKEMEHIEQLSRSELNLESIAKTLMGWSKAMIAEKSLRNQLSMSAVKGVFESSTLGSAPKAMMGTLAGFSLIPTPQSKLKEKEEVGSSFKLVPPSPYDEE